MAVELNKMLIWPSRLQGCVYWGGVARVSVSDGQTLVEAEAPWKGYLATQKAISGCLGG